MNNAKPENTVLCMKGQKRKGESENDRGKIANYDFWTHIISKIYPELKENLRIQTGIPELASKSKISFQVQEVPPESHNFNRNLKMSNQTHLKSYRNPRRIIIETEVFSTGIPLKTLVEIPDFLQETDNYH